MIWVVLRLFSAAITNFLLDEPLQYSLVSCRVSAKITRRLEYCQISKRPDKESKMSDCADKKVLLGLSKEEISSLLPDCPKYTASQIRAFLFDGKDFDEMTSLKKD